MSYYYVQPTLPLPNNRYSGQCYAFGASGGFRLLQGFNRINERPPDLLSKYDVTDAIQIYFSAASLNAKIGIIKDASNTHTIQAWYDPDTDRLHYDSLKLCSCEFVNGINLNSMVSVGKLSTIYSDFKDCVANYFGDPGGFASLFSGDQEFEVNNSVFDASAFIQIVNSSKFNMSGSFVSDLSGNVTVSDINNLLQYVVDGNIFGNRNPSTLDWGIVQGFVGGDLIFIPTGFTITLSLDIQAETYLPINNIGPDNLHAIRNRLNWTRGSVTRSTTSTLTNITQTTTVPILMILTDDPIVNNHLNFGVKWSTSNPLNTTVGQANWLACSLSTTGQYQSIITASGDVYNTSNYGVSWTNTYNIEVSQSNSVAISFTGMHQTISNGHKIWVSNDYGQTWTLSYDGGTSNIFVAISLSGRYQTVVSSGDNVYTSDDYGKSWRVLDESTDLYNSIETFPTGGIAISYNGQYQTIVVENIYISSDFGRNWTNVNGVNNFDERNWSGVAMSSDGMYQTAIENGGEVNVSTDYGNTWLFVDDTRMIDKEWVAVAVSANGQYQTVLEQNGYIYTSSDYGKTWNTSPDPIVANKTWQAVAISSDAMIQLALDSQGTIYTSNLLSGDNTTRDSSGNIIFDASGNPPCVCIYDPSAGLIDTSLNGVLSVNNLYVSSTSVAAMVSWNMDTSGNCAFIANLNPPNLDNISNFNIVNASSFTIHRLTAATTYTIYVSRKVMDSSGNTVFSEPASATFTTLMA